MAVQKHNRSERTKDRLIRGLDLIPDDWELASAWRALQSIRRSRATLSRLLTNRAAATARDLRGALTALERASAHISGGFSVKEIEPLARMWGRLQRKVARASAARRAREARS
jgi:hypothetical protein